MEAAGADPPRSRGEANVPDELVVRDRSLGTPDRPRVRPPAQEAEAGRHQAACPFCQDARGAFCSQIISAGDP